MQSISLYAAKLSAGPLTQSILKQIPDDFHDYAEANNLRVIVDSRVHQLRKGEYPAEPGWHCDSPYNESAILRYFLLCTISSHPNGISNTEFLKAPTTLTLNVPKYISTNNLWRTVDKNLQDDNKTETTRMKDGVLTCMNNQTLHRATPAEHDGVRLFVRVSHQVKTPVISDDNASHYKGFLPGIRV